MHVHNTDHRYSPINHFAPPTCPQTQNHNSRPRLYAQSNGNAFGDTAPTQALTLPNTFNTNSNSAEMAPNDISDTYSIAPTFELDENFAEWQYQHFTM